MKRRAFLQFALPAAALATGLPGCNGGGDGAPAVGGAPGVGATQYPKLNFVTQDPAYSDYRPAVDATGQRVLFERTPVGVADPLTTLAIVDSLTAPTPAAFLTAANNPGTAIPPSQTRPDWSWVTGQVALNGAATNKAPVEVYLVAGDGTGLAVMPNSQAWLYPIWTHDGKQLIVYNNKNLADPLPSTNLVWPDGTVAKRNLNGNDAGGTPVFGGFAAPNPGNASNVAYAGQPVIAGWGLGSTTECPADPSGYNQCYNYPFVNAVSNGTFTSSPLEAGANIWTFDPAYQGRAPYWSPNGKYLVFESNRLGGYAIFLVNLTKGTPPVAVTDPAYGAQHAKFFPTGNRLILTALQTPSANGNGPRGIAWIDISAYL